MNARFKRHWILKFKKSDMTCWFNWYICMVFPVLFQKSLLGPPGSFWKQIFHCNINNNPSQWVHRGEKWSIRFTGSILGGVVPLPSEDHNLCIKLCFISNLWKDGTGTKSISCQSPLVLFSWALNNSRYRHTNQRGFGITQRCLRERVSFLAQLSFLKSKWLCIKMWHLWNDLIKEEFWSPRASSKRCKNPCIQTVSKS